MTGAVQFSVTWCWTAVPMPLSRTSEVLPLVELLVNVSVPVDAPTVAGSNCTCIVIAMVGFRVTGKVAPDIVNPEPVRLTALTVTGELPVEVRVTD